MQCHECDRSWSSSVFDYCDAEHTYSAFQDLPLKKTKPSSRETYM